MSAYLTCGTLIKIIICFIKFLPLVCCSSFDIIFLCISYFYSSGSGGNIITRRLCRNRRREDNELYRSNSFKFERFERKEYLEELADTLQKQVSGTIHYLKGNQGKWDNEIMPHNLSPSKKRKKNRSKMGANNLIGRY